MKLEHVVAVGVACLSLYCTIQEHVVRAQRSQNGCHFKTFIRCENSSRFKWLQIEKTTLIVEYNDQDVSVLCFTIRIFVFAVKRSNKSACFSLLLIRHCLFCADKTTRSTLTG